MTKEKVSWIREAISDELGQADIAYIAIWWLAGAMVGAVIFLCIMSAVTYARCEQIVDVGQGVRASIPCAWDPQPLGLSVAACLGAFGAPISALALYMNQTRRRVAEPVPTRPGVTLQQNVTLPSDIPAPTVGQSHAAMG